MNEVYTYAISSDFRFVIAALLLCFLAVCFAGLVRYAFRSLSVLVRGWPPAHLDADGNWKPTEDGP